MFILNFIKANWKLLLIVFGLGGTAAVAGVIPGLEGTKDYVNSHLEAVEGKLVSPGE